MTRVTTRAELRVSDDRQAMRDLAMRSGLEDGILDNIVSQYGFFADDEMVACAALRRVGDVFSVEWLAVDEAFRGRGMGGKLVARLAEDAKAMGAKDLWALARAPEFFLRIGFRLSSESESPGPTYEGCVRCAQYKVTCHPRIVVLGL